MNFRKAAIPFLYAFLGSFFAFLAFNFFIYKKQEVKVVERVIEVPNTRQVSFNALQENSLVDFGDAVDNSIQAVVHVKTTMSVENVNSPLLDIFFGPNGIKIPPMEGYGSGVIISEDGYILTNNHVIAKSNHIEVVLNDKRTYVAKLIGTDPSTDVALLKIDSKNLPKVELGNSDDIQIGEWVLAVGNPFNLTSTVTAGIISAKARNINLLRDKTSIESFIQTDAAVNPGNSGGALVNTKGELIGINTAIASKNGSFTGYAFAIPINMAKKIVDDIIEYGSVQRAYLGVDLKEIDAIIAKQMKMENIRGVLISGTSDNSAAHEAGIKKSDVIVKIDDNEINKVSELMELLSMFRPGDDVKVTVLRDGVEIEFSVKLRNKDGNEKIRGIIEVLGASFEEVPIKEKVELKIDFGVKVVDIKAGKLLKAGMQDGFIIQKINNQEVKEIKDVKRILNEARGAVYIEGKYPDGNSAYYAFGLR